MTTSPCTSQRVCKFQSVATNPILTKSLALVDSIYGGDNRGARIILAQCTREDDVNAIFKAAVVQGHPLGTNATYVVFSVKGATRREALDKVVMELELMSEGILKRLDASRGRSTYERVRQHDTTQGPDNVASRGRGKSTAKSRTEASSRDLATDEDEDCDDDMAESKPASRRVLRSTMRLKDEANSDTETMMIERSKSNKRK
jgi:hypothetical protein